ncbi:MAG: S41 family peptidase [Turicibacter sp.]|nr:S41 family peptidase [Turicibacter sp.]
MKIQKIILALLLAIFAACGADEELGLEEEPPIYGVYEESAVEDGEENDENEPLVEVIEVAFSPDDVFTSGRTRAEYLEDVDFLYYILTNNFPFMGVIERRNGFDMRQAFADLRLRLETIEDIMADRVFYAILENTLSIPAAGLGHFGIQSNVDWLVNVYGRMIPDGLDSPWVSLLDNPTTREFYQLTDEIFDFSDLEIGEIPGEMPAEWDIVSPYNVQTDILTDGVAYVAISSFNSQFARHDTEVLLEFFREVADFEHLIIDIRGNGGGWSGYFPQLVMMPNISESMAANFYMLFSAHPHNMIFLNFREMESNPIDEEFLERLVYLNEDDAEMLDVYFRAEFLLEPLEEQAIFGGKIWLMVDRVVFSASELAAQMVQQTGFATIVGEPTGGDGLGIDPFIVTLPNTGIAFRFAASYGVDSLGRNNQEFATTPDILLPMERALEALLEIISEGDWE